MGKLAQTKSVDPQPFTPPTTTELPSPFSVLEKRQPPLFQQQLRLAADASALNPLYCPPQVFVAWAIDGVGEGSINELRNERGYELATLDMVTDDINKARQEGLICLKYFQPDTTNQYVKYRELFLMVTKREWWENRQKIAMHEAQQQVSGITNYVEGATIERDSFVGAVDQVDELTKE